MLKLSRDQIFLHSDETTKAESQWGPRNSSEQRIVIAPGGGFSENAGATKLLPSIRSSSKNKNYQICIIGSIEDKKRISINKMQK